MDFKYTIADIECLEDYFCLQYKNEDMDKVEIIECYNDSDCINLYKKLQTMNDRAFYFYSIDYDKTMLNALCKLVEKKQTNIVNHLRKINDFLIYKGIHYFKLNREFWGYFYSNDNDFDLTMEKMKFVHPESELHEFLNNYKCILGKSKLYKNLIINEIPKIMFYYNIDIKGNIKPSISLKSLNLIKKGYNIKFDFSKYSTITKVKADGLYDKWIEYSENDVLFLEELFKERPLEDIKKRYWAFRAAKSIDNSLELSPVDLYAENNTGLIVSILKLPDPNKDIQIDYTKYINTLYPEFNNFVKFVNDYSYIEKDRELKERYCEQYKKTYIDDDKRIENDLLINSFDEIKINETIVKIGLGGAHAAIDKYIGENLQHLDYESQYSSIILQHKELFENIINIPLYEAIYDLKNKSLKIEKKELEKEIEKMCNIINDGGCDGADIEEYGPQIELKEKRKEEINNLISGIKLILNTTYGLINSNFTLPISCKTLGRFICLTGQSLLLNLAYKLTQYDPECKLINLNTDGIIVKTNKDPGPIIEADKNGYFKLESKKINNLIQLNVNSYIKDKSLKGQFNIKIKQNINKHGRLSVNTINAIRLINNEDIKILPIYFDVKRIDLPERAYYFTLEKVGKLAIKQIKQPEILSIQGEKMYFTDDIEKADKSLYQKYAEMTKQSILDFTFIDKENTNLPYIEVELYPDIEENIKEKRKQKRALYKLFGKEHIGFVGYKANSKANSYYPTGPINQLVWYTMTEIQNSTYCQGFSVHDFFIIDIDIFDKKTNKAKKGWSVCKDLINELKEAKTFEAWNNKTEKYNRKFIFKCEGNYKIKKQYEKYIEILDKATIYTLYGERIYNYIAEPIEIDPKLLSKFFDKL